MLHFQFHYELSIGVTMQSWLPRCFTAALLHRTQNRTRLRSYVRPFLSALRRYSVAQR